MQEIIETAEVILGEIVLFATDFWLLFAVLGGLVLVLILWKVLRRSSRVHGDDGDIEFLEVGPEPVIVYRRASEQQNNPLPEPEPQPEPEPEPQLEPELEPLPLTIPKPDLLPIMEIDPQLLPDPEPQPDTEPKELIKGSLAKNSPPSKPAEPLPYLESELANDALALFIEQSFMLEKVLYQGKYGADFIIVRPGVRAYIQVKDWKAKSTDKTVQEVYNYADSNDCNQVILLSQPGADRSATKAAKKMGVILWNPKDLKKHKKQLLILRDQEAAPAKD